MIACVCTLNNVFVDKCSVVMAVGIMDEKGYGTPLGVLTLVLPTATATTSTSFKLLLLLVLANANQDAMDVDVDADDVAEAPHVTNNGDAAALTYFCPLK
jgi:hypothetical protein